MSTTRTSHRPRPGEELTATAEDAVFDEASRLLGLERQGARRVHHHASTVYVLPSEDAVVRIRRSSCEQDRRAIMVSRWLVEQGFPATQPLGVEQPVTLGAWTATCWRYYPQVGRPPPEPRHLGRLLRRLHDLAPPPLELPRYAPLASLVRSVRSTEFLPDDDRNWLLERSEHLLDVYEGLDSPLGHGHIHGDAYPGNLLWNSAQVVLGDWDETSVGPRELDLVNTYQGVRFGRTELELSEFAAAYGHDVARWRGFSTLRAIRDLHTLGAYLRRGDRGDQAARHEVLHRIDTLRRGKLTARWATG